MSSAALRSLHVAKKSDPRPLAERGRMMLAAHIVEILPKDKAGEPIRSELWVRRNFAPDKKRYIGKSPYWWEVDVLAALDAGIGP